MNYELVDAIDNFRRNEGAQLHDILARMIVVRGVTLPDDINDVRDCLYENIVELINRGSISIDIAKQLGGRIVSRRVADLYRKKKRSELIASSQIVSLEEAVGYGEDVASPLNVEENYLTQENIQLVMSALEELRLSKNSRDQRDCRIIEAFLDEAPMANRISEIEGRQISTKYAATLLYQAKRRLKRVLLSKGMRSEDL